MSSSGAPSRFDAIVLAGGAGRRLGGVDKASLTIGGDTLLDRALRAVARAANVVVVGPPRRPLPRRPLPRGVLSTSEEPPGGGPVAGIEAGLDLVDAPLVVVLACDMPFVTASTVADLVGMLDIDEGQHADGAVLVDDGGRPQPLAAAYRTEPLRAAVAGLPHTRDAAVRDLTRPLTLAEQAVDADLTHDCDTWPDVAWTRERLEEP
ncbi:MAG: molybdenum cofactor guanylyltransferase [Nocardioidaceae bacterium]